MNTIFCFFTFLLVTTTTLAQSTSDEIKEIREELRLIKGIQTKRVDALNISGGIQMRLESATNRQGVQGVSQGETIYSRLRLAFSLKASERLKLKLTPQAAKVFGSSLSGVSTSGTTNSPGLTFHEATVTYKFSDKLSGEFGTQELSYGDELVLGALGWANNGRNFDALKFRYTVESGKVDLFFSKINDNSDGVALSESTLRATDDKDLYGIYSSFSINSFLNPFDMYLLHQKDRSTNASPAEINTLGIRLLGDYNSFFYRMENTVQSGSGLEDAYQHNFELGANTSFGKVSAEYGIAGEEYEQLYPTAHKFLGIADVLGRRNISFLALHYKNKIKSWLALGLSYHKFERLSDDVSAIKLTGGAWGTNGTSKDIGEEVDFVLNFISPEIGTLQLGAGIFRSGEYLIEQDANEEDENTQFLYAMIKSKF